MKVSLNTNSTNIIIRTITFDIWFPETKSLIFYPMFSKDILNIKILVIVLITISKKQALSTTCIVKQTIVIAYYIYSTSFHSNSTSNSYKRSAVKGQSHKHTFGVYLFYHVIKFYRSLLHKTLNISAHSAWIIQWTWLHFKNIFFFFYWYFYQNN